MMDLLEVALPTSTVDSPKSTIILTTASSDGRINLYDLAQLSTLSTSKEIQPSATFDTDKTRLTSICAIGLLEKRVKGTTEEEEEEESDSEDDDQEEEDDDDALVDGKFAGEVGGEEEEEFEGIMINLSDNEIEEDSQDDGQPGEEDDEDEDEDDLDLEGLVDDEVEE